MKGEIKLKLLKNLKAGSYRLIVWCDMLRGTTAFNIKKTFSGKSFFIKLVCFVHQVSFLLVFIKVHSLSKYGSFW